MQIVCSLAKTGLVDIVVDGIWGSWSPYEACSKTCDDGIKIRTRNCTFPPNVVHGKDCAGLDMETTICNEGDCPGLLTVDSINTQFDALTIDSF